MKNYLPNKLQSNNSSVDSIGNDRSFESENEESKYPLINLTKTNQFSLLRLRKYQREEEMLYKPIQ